MRGASHGSWLSPGHAPTLQPQTRPLLPVHRCRLCTAFARSLIGEISFHGALRGLDMSFNPFGTERGNDGMEGIARDLQARGGEVKGGCTQVGRGFVEAKIHLWNP